MQEIIGRWARWPPLNAIIGLFMVGSAVLELAGDFIEDVFGAPIGAAHGLLVVGLLQTLKGVPELLAGIEKIRSSETKPPT